MGKNKSLIVGAAVVILAIAGYFLIRINNDQLASDTSTLDTGDTTETSGTPQTTVPEAAPAPTTTSPASASPASTPPASTPPAPASTYKNGTYTATGNYVSPGGQQGVEVTVTLKDDVVASIKVVSKAVDPTSEKFQGQFISGYQSLVIGKDIDAVSVSKVSGSSLTARGFNDALEKIKAQAKS